MAFVAEPFITWPSNGLYDLAVCIMASTAEEWSFMAEIVTLVGGSVLGFVGFGNNIMKGNVLLLRNNLKLSPDSYEVSQERLMIDDFEFTPECAIFDLLDIPLYHGWIVDPQDVETADAIGSKSYNALMGELVALETQNVQHENPGEDSVDFVAATTAALGVPSPCLSKTSSFQDSPPAAVELRKLRKGDLEEETELLQALQLSQGNGPAPNAHGDSANLDSAFTFSDASPTSTLGDNICHLEQFKSDGSTISISDIVVLYPSLDGVS
ncbi:hypothetical protein F2Q69_00042749 [Brassica cretica]|uniref:MINDY deubiquitinase domain-containing protein n=1 Tax=Brassica cretica TaxID=69181 RepID=A0A8S9NDQ0_BRACR|nr:hypothetical protein F2Q69_00042749 [Brassica cretica]